jgi:hypothetical protein
MEDDTYPSNDADEFRYILKCLDDIELTAYHNALELTDVNEQRRYLREQIRLHNKLHDGKLYNAYFARVLVSSPMEYVKREIINRFNVKSL